MPRRFKIKIVELDSQGSPIPGTGLWSDPIEAWTRAQAMREAIKSFALAHKSAFDGLGFRVE